MCLELNSRTIHHTPHMFPKCWGQMASPRSLPSHSSYASSMLLPHSGYRERHRKVEREAREKRGRGGGRRGRGGGRREEGGGRRERERGKEKGKREGKEEEEGGEGGGGEEKGRGEKGGRRRGGVLFFLSLLSSPMAEGPLLRVSSREEREVGGLF